jgi:hypothetical protein
VTDDLRRVDIGFLGGQVLSVKLPGPNYEDLQRALGDERAERWLQLKTIDSNVAIDLSKVVYVRLDADAQRVGF